MSAPAAAQTLRSMSVLGVVDTKQRCALSQDQSSDKDLFASSDRQFPESFLPMLKIPAGDPALDAKFGLASRRGAIVANTIVAPLTVLAVTSLVGYVRTRTSNSFKSYGFLAGGRTPSLVAAVLGSLFLDGIFCSAIVLLTVPGGPSGGDAVLALFGLLASVTVVAIPAFVLVKEMAWAKGSKRPIECVPAVIRSKLDPEGTKAAGLYKWLFGDEIWTGDPVVLEKFRALFATCRGMSEQYELEFGKIKRLRRWLSTWSFYIDITFTAIAAGGRGWATTSPCVANNKVQLLQFFVSLVAFLFVCAIQPPISPMRRCSDIFGNFLLVLSTFILAVLGAESGELVGKCALAAAFVATCSTLFLFVCRRIVLPLRGQVICSRNSVTHSGTITDEIDLADLLALPLMDDGEVERPQEQRGQARRRVTASNGTQQDDDDDLESELLGFSSSADAELKSFLSSPASTSSNVNNNNNNFLEELLLPPAVVTRASASGVDADNRRLDRVLSGDYSVSQNEENEYADNDYYVDDGEHDETNNNNNGDDLWANFSEDVENFDNQS